MTVTRYRFTSLLFALLIAGRVVGAPPQDIAIPTWSVPENVSGSVPGKSLFPWVSPRKGGGALVVWAQAFADTAWDTDEILFREYDGTGWSPIQNASSTPTASGSPLVVSDRQGVIHVLWLEKRGLVTPGGRALYSDLLYRTRTGTTWSQRETVYHTGLPPGINPMGVEVAVDDEGQLHVVWLAFETPGTLYARRQGWGANLWRWVAPKEVFRGGMADIATDASGKIHAVFASTPGFRKPATPERVNDLFYTYSADGGRSWAERVLVHDSGTQPAFFPNIVVDRTRRIHVLWAKDYNGDLFPDDILHSLSADGLQWSDPVSITQVNAGVVFPGGNVFPPSVAADPSNRLHAVWEWTPYFGSGISLLYYARWEDARWTEPVRLFENVRTPSLCVDEQGTLHLIWTGVHLGTDGRTQSRIFYSQARTDPESVLPESYRLYANRPNPFNAQTVIGYWLPQPERVRLRVYDLLGRQIAVLVDGVESGGRHEVTFDGSRLPSGVYFYALEVGSDRLVRKMAVVR